MSFSVFISTSHELEALRDEIQRTLLAAGVQATTQDHTLAESPRDVRHLLAKAIDHRDVVLHIAGDH